jgi:hypothetical protein
MLRWKREEAALTLEYRSRIPIAAVAGSAMTPQHP